MTNFIPPVTGSLGPPINKENFLLKLSGAARLGAVHHHCETPSGEQEGSMKCRGGRTPGGQNTARVYKIFAYNYKLKTTHIHFD